MKNKNSNNSKKKDIDSGNTVTSSPRSNPVRPEMQCETVCQKEKPPYTTKIVSTVALLTAIAAAGFSCWQAVITKGTAERQLRAYIVPDSIVIKNPINIGSPIKLQLSVSNMGQSPAYKVSQSCIFRVAKSPHNYSTAEFKKDSDRGIAIIGKEQIPFDNVSTTISDREIGDVISQKYELFYYAIVRYSDIFSHSHVLHVCAEYSVKSGSFSAMPDCNYEE